MKLFVSGRVMPTYEAMQFKNRGVTLNEDNVKAVYSCVVWIGRGFDRGS